MSESTLTLTRGDIKREIRRYLQYILLPGSTLETDQEQTLLDITLSGERAFYEPALPPGPNGKPQTYVWSFLRGIVTLSLTSATVDLPDDFAGFLDDKLAFTSTKTWSLDIVEYWRVAEKLQDYGTSEPSGSSLSQPVLAAIVPKTFTNTAGQRQQLTMWPTPSGSPSVRGRYKTTPAASSTTASTTDDAKYAMGGQSYSHVLLESCLAAAEAYVNNRLTTHRTLFQQYLASAIEMDKRLHQAEAA
jgi:hypothetical protein